MTNINRKQLKIVSLILVLIFTVACSREKNVKTEEFDLFKEEISSNEKIDDIQIKFTRPSLFISLITSEDFEISDVEKVIDELRPVINVNHMDEIARKYWGEGEDTRVSSVYVYFYNGEIDKNDRSKNLIYTLNTDYYKTHRKEDSPSNIDGYRTWFIEVDGDEYQVLD